MKYRIKIINTGARSKFAVSATASVSGAVNLLSGFGLDNTDIDNLLDDATVTKLNSHTSKRHHFQVALNPVQNKQ